MKKLFYALAVILLQSCHTSKPRIKTAGNPVIKAITEYSYYLNDIDTVSKKRKLLYVMKYVYDTNGNQISDSNFHAKGWLQAYHIFEYYKGKSTTKTYLGNGFFANETVYIYDKNGKKTEHARYSAMLHMDYKTTYFYDSAQNLIKTIEYDADNNEPIQVVTYKYNGRGLLSEEDQIDYKYTNSGHTSYTYHHFDTQHNWLSMTTVIDTTIFGQPSTYKERVIEYY